METVLTSRNDIKKTEILRRYEFFREANPALKKEILANSSSVLLKPNSIYFHAGDKIQQLAFIGAGSVRVFIVSECGREITLYHLQAGDACPINILSILLNKETPAIAVVETMLNAVVVDAVYFKGSS